MHPRSKVTQKTMRGSKTTRASVTILIVTFVYIIFNVPVCIFYILYPSDKSPAFKSEFYSSLLMYWFIRALLEVFSVALNSALNPIVYLWRITPYRVWVLNKFTHPGTTTFVSTAPPQGEMFVLQNLCVIGKIESMESVKKVSSD